MIYHRASRASHLSLTDTLPGPRMLPYLLLGTPSPSRHQSTSAAVTSTRVAFPPGAILGTSPLTMTHQTMTCNVRGVDVLKPFLPRERGNGEEHTLLRMEHKPYRRVADLTIVCRGLRWSKRWTLEPDRALTLGLESSQQPESDSPRSATRR